MAKLKVGQRWQVCVEVLRNHFHFGSLPGFYWGACFRPWSANAASSPRANGAIKECDMTVFRVEAEIETSYYPHKVSRTRARYRTAKF